MILILHKPYGVLCQFTPDRPGQKTLGDFGFPKGVYPVGRLDMDSEGLLVLCDEPGFNNRFLSPENAHPRTYLVQVEGIPTEHAVRQLAAGGLVIKGHTTRPCHVSRINHDPGFPPRDPPIRERKSIPTSWLEMSLIEGKNRQVRRMTAAVGFPTLRLIRTRIGKLAMDSLPTGEWREVSRLESLKLWER